MEVLFLEAPYKGEIKLCPKTLHYLQKKKYKNIGLYAPSQFVPNLEKVKKSLREMGLRAVTSQPDRAHYPAQLLGCDLFSGSLNLKAEVDTFLYIGDGRFHPLALVYLQKDLSKGQVKEVICDDPLAGTFSVLDVSGIKNVLKRYRGALLKFLRAGKVGIIITVKPGQEQLKFSSSLEKKYPQKKVYYFVDDNISFSQLENFPFIDVWVNTACPRIAFDEQEQFRKGVINLSDALDAEKILSIDSVLNQL